MFASLFAALFVEFNLVDTAQSSSTGAACPRCGQVSSRVHSYYTRAPQDLPGATVGVGVDGAWGRDRLIVMRAVW
jgi:hypothetical protein